MIRTVQAARVAWVATAVAGWFAAQHALDGRTAAASTVTTVVLWSLWAAIAVASIVPSTVGLTVVRTAGPLAVAAGAVLWICGAGALRGGATCAAAALFTTVAFGADVGQTFVQASAYGDEQRFPLRAPAAMVPPMVLSWLIWAAAMVVGATMLAARQWIGGTLVAVVATALSVLLLPRFHQLARRWLVLVPAGVVIHDPAVLADTLMLTKPKVAGLRLAETSTEAADLSGPAAGHLVEVSLREMETVVLAATRSKPTGAALHVQSFLVAPSRPGRALNAAAAGRLTVG